MNFLAPIHTEKTQCQDCYKCVRNCPVKAIKVESACAQIMPEACILCGNCVLICPNGAKKVRDDLHRARQLLGMRSKSHRLVGTLVRGGVSRSPAGADDRRDQTAGLLGRVGDGAGRAAGVGARRRHARGRRQARAGFDRVSERRRVSSEASLGGRRAVPHAAALAAAQPLQAAALDVRQRYRGRLLRPVHRQESRIRCASGTARRGVDV